MSVNNRCKSNIKESWLLTSWKKSVRIRLLRSAVLASVRWRAGETESWTCCYVKSLLAVQETCGACVHVGGVGRTSCLARPNRLTRGELYACIRDVFRIFYCTSEKHMSWYLKRDRFQQLQYLLIDKIKINCEFIIRQK